MPDALKKQMFGLPRWAWLIIVAAAIGVGLYLRHKKKLEEEAESQSEEEGGTTGVLQPEPVGSAYGATGVEGGGEYYPSAEGYYPQYYPNEFPHEQPETPPSVTVNVGAPTQPSATDGGSAPGSSAGATGKPCKGDKPKPHDGGHYECVSGKWKFVGGHHGGSQGVVTGGGPPDKKNNKGPKVGATITAPPPPANAQHPQAVDTGNPCVNGGVGKHTAPPGYHLFCQNGKIWRAPNS